MLFDRNVEPLFGFSSRFLYSATPCFSECVFSWAVWELLKPALLDTLWRSVTDMRRLRRTLTYLLTYLLLFSGLSAWCRLLWLWVGTRRRSRHHVWTDASTDRQFTAAVVRVTDTTRCAIHMRRALKSESLNDTSCRSFCRKRISDVFLILDETNGQKFMVIYVTILMYK